MRSVYRFALLSVVVGSVMAGSAAAGVKINVDPGAKDFMDRAGLNEASLQNEIERVFQVHRIDDYLRAVGNSYAFTTKGMGVDYATNIDYLVFGAAASVAANAEGALTPEDAKTKPPVAALTTNWTLMGGLNFGLFGFKPLTLYFNYFKGSGSLGDEFNVSLKNWGAHAQLKLFGPKKSGLGALLIQWGGIAVTTGVDYSSSTLTLGKKLKRSFPMGSVNNMPVQVGFDAMGTFDVALETTSIPLELTTSLQLLSLLTVYGGGGFDWQLGGGSEMKIAVAGKMTGTVNTQATHLGDASVNEERRVDPSRGRLRAIGGVQLNILVVRLFAQVNLVPDPFLASIGFGARVAF